MCAVVEEYAEKYADKQVLETVKSFIAAGASNKLIKEATNLTDDEIDKLRSELS